MHPFLRALCLLALGAALVPAAADAPEDGVPASLLVYRVSEQGVEPYLSRILVTSSYVRMDHGSGDQGFMLFDRDSQVIYSANPAERTVLVVDPVRRKPAAPLRLTLSEQRHDDEQAPAIAGVKPVRYELGANGEVCRNLIVLPGVMEPAVGGLREYLEVLSYQQGAALTTLPEDLHDACDMSRHVYNPGRELTFGLPVQSWSATEHRELVDFREDFRAAPELFEIPEGYGRMGMPRPSR